MPKVLTKYFGSLEYEPKDVVKFPSGLPAFEEELEFIVIEPAAKAPLAFLQSLRQPGLCFLTLPILAPISIRWLQLLTHARDPEKIRGSSPDWPRCSDRSS